MKKITLDKAWELTIEMWEDLAAKFDYVSAELPYVSYDDEKDWLKKNHPEYVNILGSCFFCEYARQHDSTCNSCPGKLVNDNFDCTDLKRIDPKLSVSDNYANCPKEFLVIIKKLDKQRKSKSA